MATAHVLIADITGSTKLYEQLSDLDALAQISMILARMRETIEENGGHCVKSQGDDTLSFFGVADQAFAAARSMIEAEWNYGLAVHAGIYCGDVLSQDADIYGDAVNTAARLATLAKPNEILIGDTVFDALSKGTQELCVSMGGIKLKGKSESTAVHSFTVSALSTQTVLFGAAEASLGRRTESVTLNTDDVKVTLMDAQSAKIGRASNCNLVLNHPWVSREHGSFELRAAQLEYTDHSSFGSTVITGDGQEFAVHRRSMLLNGEGMVLVGTNDPSVRGSVVRYATNDLVPDA
ncbi:MAG: adenylate/guanylate cyclase domain-containing protein [Pseudomonadota bacterium]